jgi:ATP-binding cassette subfamily F protein 3
VVQIENVALSFAGKPLFRNVNWRIGDDDRVGLVGPNGCGKTTLLRLIRGDIHPDEGTISASRNATYGYLPQEELTLRGRTLFDECMTVFGRLSVIESRMRELEHHMGEIPPEDPEHDRVMREYAELHHEFEAKDGFTVDNKVAEVLSGLGFAVSDRDRMTEEFSGGWQMRIALAKLLLKQPNVLLLDEPTNHLDLESIIWLEEYLRTYPGAVVLVSHDRAFLDKVVQRISEVWADGLVDYYGGWSAYREQREKRRETLQSTRNQQEKRIAQIQRFIDKHRADKFQAAMVQSRIRMLEKIELVEVPRDRKGIHFEFPQPPRAASVPVSVRGLRKAYGDKVVFDGIDFDVSRGDRVAIVGLNGAGKSTLLNVIAGRTPYQGGDVKVGNNVTVEYFGQDPSQTLNRSRTVLAELESVAPNDVRPRLRNLLGAFLFSGDDVEKMVGVLSGGEKSRLAIAKMLLRPANLLLLDEPTNHLDVSAREVLEDALARYTGTICLVSHDRAFMDRLATKVLEIDRGRLRLFHGNYSDYLYAKERERAEQSVGAAAAPRERRAGGEGGTQTRETPKRGGPKSKDQKRKEAEARSNLSVDRRKRRDERRRVMDDIAKGERRLEEIRLALADPLVYADGARTKKLVNEQRALQSKVDRLYARWAELED